jgi:hypothetical protein
MYTDTEIRNMVIEYNGDCDEWTDTLSDLARQGDITIQVAVTSDSYGTLRISAFPAVMVGTSLAAACDPVCLARWRPARGMTMDSAGTWWARKHFGKAFPIVITKHV